MADTSIQANLRKNGLKKKASERTWREWDAIYDYERALVDKHHDLTEKYRLQDAQRRHQFYRAVAGYLLLGIGFGMLITMFVYNYYHIDYNYTPSFGYVLCEVDWKNN